eukprot:1299027-Lingulodinium_polyedra.AAC.1
MTEQPLGSRARELGIMRQRPALHTAVVAQCRFGLQDPESGKPYRKETALDTNDPRLASELAREAGCLHRPGEHEVILGSTRLAGRA